MSVDLNATRIATIGPEQMLVLAAARTIHSATSAARINDLISRPLDWGLVTQFAERHGVEPLLYRTFMCLKPAPVPMEVLHHLAATYHANRERNLAFAQELCHVSTSLMAERIPVLSFKGPLLALVAYGDLELRCFFDLDLIVRPDDVQLASELLLADGYQIRLLLDHECSFFHPDRSIKIDLHWSFTPSSFPFALFFDKLWPRTYRVPIDGVALPSCAPDDLLLILAVHGAKHEWIRLQWIADIAELLRRLSSDIEWPLLLRRARALGAHRMLALALVLARDLVDAPLPTVAVTAVERNRVVASLGRAVARALFADPAEPDLLAEHAFSQMVRERWRDRVAQAVWIVRSSSTQSIRWQLPLPAILSLLHVLLRPAWRAARAVGRRVRGHRYISRRG